MHVVVIPSERHAFSVVLPVYGGAADLKVTQRKKKFRLSSFHSSVEMNKVEYERENKRKLN